MKAFSLIAIITISLIGIYFVVIAPQLSDETQKNSEQVSYYENEEGEILALSEGFYTIKDPITKETLKIDGRLFSTTPNTIAKDENWKQSSHDFMTLVTPRSPNLSPYYIDAFEGLISANKAWSTPGQTPTDRLRYKDAQNACRASGKRLCTETEWRTACRGGLTTPAQFKNLNEIAKHCDVIRKKAFTGILSTTDAHPYCSAPGLNVYNLIGNLSEFVTSEKGEPMIIGLNIEHGYNKNIAQELSYACEKTVKAAGTYRPFKYYNYRGFRCCKNVE